MSERDRPTYPRRWPAVLIGLVAIAGVSTGSVFAASLGTLVPKNLGSQTSAVSACTSATLGLTTRTALKFDTSTSYRYEIRQVIYTGVPATCQGQTFKLTVADSYSGYVSLAETNGTMPANLSATLNFPTGAGPNLNSINSTNSATRDVLVIVGP